MTKDIVSTRATVFSLFFLLFAGFIATQILQFILVAEGGYYSFRAIFGLLEIVLLSSAAVGVKRGSRWFGLILGNILILSYLALSIIQLPETGTAAAAAFTTLPLALAAYVLNVRLRPHFRRENALAASAPQETALHADEPKRLVVNG